MITRVVLIRVFRDTDTNIEYRARLSILLSDVAEFEEYVYNDHFKQITGKKTTITMKGSFDHYVILMSFEQFSELMYNKNFPDDCLEIPISLN